MAELVPAANMPATTPSLLAPLTDPAGGPALSRVGSFIRQPPVRRTLPWFGAVAGIGMMALAWATLAPQPQRTLYSELDDGERAKVATGLDKAGIAYRIDSQTGALSVGEDDLYKAKMLVASDGALAAPDEASSIDKLPLGASRAVEGDRLRASHEHDLTRSIMEIDGVEAVRVHLAEAEKSVFVRDNIPPSASGDGAASPGPAAVRQPGGGDRQPCRRISAGAEPRCRARGRSARPAADRARQRQLRTAGIAGPDGRQIARPA